MSIDKEVLKINESILALWEKHSEQKIELAPLLFSSFQRDGLLTVGMNPSFSPAEISKFSNKSKEEITKLFSWRNIKELNTREILQIDELSRKEYGRFFSKFKEIECSINLPHQHIDLFFYRKTSQPSFLKDIMPHGTLTNFAKDQLDIVRKIITIINPKIILIANAEASRKFKEYFKEWFMDIDQLDETLGTYILNINNRRVPLFLSSMLSNGATSNENYERLKWHVEFVNNMLSQPNKFTNSS